MGENCLFCNKTGFEYIMIKGSDLGAVNFPICKSHYRDLLESILDDTSCVFCGDYPNNELEFSNKDIGDYEAGKRPNVIRLCDKHLGKVEKYQD